MVVWENNDFLSGQLSRISSAVMVPWRGPPWRLTKPDVSRYTVNLLNSCEVSESRSCRICDSHRGVRPTRLSSLPQSRRTSSSSWPVSGKNSLLWLSIVDAARANLYTEVTRVTSGVRCIVGTFLVLVTGTGLSLLVLFFSPLVRSYSVVKGLVACLVVCFVQVIITCHGIKRKPYHRRLSR